MGGGGRAGSGAASGSAAAVQPVSPSGSRRVRRLVAVNALLLAHLPVERLVVGLRLLLRVLAVGHALQLRLGQRAAEEAGRDRARRSLDVSVLQGRARRERVSSCPALGSFTPNEPLLGALALLLGLACFCHAAL